MNTPTTSRKFFTLLNFAWNSGRHLCIGLDPLEEKLPTSFTRVDIIEDFFQYLVKIIDATCNHAAAYKPNIAFYEGYGGAGLDLLARVIRYIRDAAPLVPVILDFKRGDIGDTNRLYARLAFDVMNADAVTLHPFMGQIAMQPFLDWEDKGLFFLARTSNKGADEFQSILACAGQLRPPLGFPLSQSEAIAHNISNTWNVNGNCGLVAGATDPEMIVKVRRHAKNMPILVPGIGKQGGDLASAILAARLPDRSGFLINVSSGITFATTGEDYAEAAGEKARWYHEQILSLNK